MNLPVRSTGPIETDDPGAEDFAGIARALAAQGSVTLVYAPPTTTINHPAPATAPVPVEVRIPGPAAPGTETAITRCGSRYTLGEVTAYSGATLMGGATLSGLVSVLIGVPMLVPLVAGVTALLGLLAALGGASLDNRERGC